MTSLEKAPQQTALEHEWADVMQPMDGDPAGKNLLSMWQYSAADIHDHIVAAYRADEYVRDSRYRGVPVLPFRVLKAVMRQPSTRTGGSMTTAMSKLGGAGELISGMHSSSEAKGESLPDSWEAFATQCDVLGTRTAEDFGPAFAARTIAASVLNGKLPEVIPVINLGDGKNEHPTQALGDLFTIHKYYGHLDRLRLTIVGDHERYRAFHSLIIGAVAAGMHVTVVESKSAPVPDELIRKLGRQISRTEHLEDAMCASDVLYIGRNPDEYSGKVRAEKKRSKKLAKDYKSWVIDNDRLQILPRDAIVLHPRPRRNELHKSVDADPRMRDVEQMANMIPSRMANIASVIGVAIPKLGEEL